MKYLSEIIESRERDHSGDYELHDCNTYAHFRDAYERCLLTECNKRSSHVRGSVDERVRSRDVGISK